uniref:AAA+ ATPase domain-containing protein n=1 Tax=Auxenochlorella protothecoides TaxID=3075 RepID=A0A1D2A7X9_AUXPR
MQGLRTTPAPFKSCSFASKSVCPTRIRLLIGRQWQDSSAWPSRAYGLHGPIRARTVWCAALNDSPRLSSSPRTPNDSSSGRDPDESEPEPGRDRRGLPGRIIYAIRQAARSLLLLLARLVPERMRAFLTPGRLRRIAASFILFYLVGGALLSSALHSARMHEVMYSDFLGHVQRGAVQNVMFDEDAQRIVFGLVPTPAEVREMRDADAAPAVPVPCYTKQVASHELIPILLKAGVRFGAMQKTLSSVATRALTTALALWLPLVPLYFIGRRALGGNQRGKQSRTPSKGAALSSATFEDVAGVDAAKQELQEVVSCLKDAGRFAALGAKLPSGVLLCGPPGTGKTLLARAVAGEAGVPFFVVSASEFVELFVGRGAARIRELFSEARKKAPCVVFIDELDAVGGRRGMGMNDEREQTLNQLLTELDGFDGRPGVLLLAATNRPESLDPALLRPGRLSRKITVPLPDATGRAAILAVHLRTVKLAGSPEMQSAMCRAIARLTPGMSGAELMNVVNEAAFLAARRDADAVDLPELVAAVDRTRNGVNGGAATPLSVLGSRLSRGIQRLIGGGPDAAPALPAGRSG